MNYKSLEQQAISLLRQASASYGILASSHDKENYKRLWARDAMIAGVASLLAGDEEVLRGFRNSILTLAEYQHEYGMIPSNVLPDGDSSQLSYGGLAGRVDATTWFIIGACLYLLNESDETLTETMQPHLNRALKVLDHWEFNGKGLIYTPLSGNWSDEYPVQGHTFYDNLLRLWGLRLYSILYDDEERTQQAFCIKEKIAVNYWPDENMKDHPAIYHRRKFEDEAGNRPVHYASSIDPTGYNMHFDTAAHGLALLMGLPSDWQATSIIQHMQQVYEDVGTSMMPSFWPVISPEDDMWHDLKNNYSFYFKNQAHHFHNGGIWPVWVGILGLGFSNIGKPELAEEMLNGWMQINSSDGICFHEYITSDTLHYAGKQDLSFSASGLIFLLSAINQNFNQILYPEH